MSDGEATAGSTPTRINADGALWVLSKPAGMAVHPVHQQTEPDLMTWCMTHLGAPAGLAPCHRLDKATSGVVLASADPKVRGDLGTDFAAQAVSKEYLALVYGKLRGEGRVERPLEDQRRRKTLDAVTDYVVREGFRRLTYLAVHPKTGRKHQIRRHLRAIKHPIVGDRRYGWKKPEPVPGFPRRLWLHAHALTLPDGRRFEAPLPAALVAHLALLRAKHGPG